MRGEWPLEARYFSKSSRRRAVVIVLVSGWTLIMSWTINAASRTTVTARACVIDDGQWRHRARFDAEIGLQPLRRSERQPARSDPLRQGFEVNDGVFQRGDEKHRFPAVAQEQIFGVGAGDLSAQRLGLFHREQGRMADRGVRDIEGIERRKQALGVAGMGNPLRIVVIHHVSGACRVIKPHLAAHYMRGVGCIGRPLLA